MMMLVCVKQFCFYQEDKNVIKLDIWPNFILNIEDITMTIVTIVLKGASHVFVVLETSTCL